MALNRYLFDELRFVGNETDYDRPAEQLPERSHGSADRHSDHALARLHGGRTPRRTAGRRRQFSRATSCCAALPGRGYGHADDLIIDPFHGGALLSACSLVQPSEDPEDDDAPPRFESKLLARATKTQILARMLVNLKRVYVNMQSFPQARDIADMLIAVDPSAIGELRDRGLLAYHLKDFSGALRDLQSYLKLIPAGPG